MTLGVLEYLISAKDDTAKGINSSERNIQKYGDKLSKWTVAKGQLIADFTKKAITSTINLSKQLVKSAVSAYADFEQLEGGVKKLFGDDVAKTIIKNANKAFSTAGLSANQYMETVTDFSASLINSLGGDTARAAEVADMAIRDMADNVNTFGSDMESVQNAYKGFSKQNYTMLDNLKLGYGGTRKEMERLLKDAEAFEKTQGKIVKYDMNNLADVYEAINAIQRKNNITGTTAKEGSSTISGSIAAAKAQWQNVLASLGSGQNVKWSVRTLGYTLRKVFKNVKPVAIEAIKGIFTGLKEILPEIGGIVNDVIGELKKSDNPVLQKVGSALEKLKGIAKTVYDLFTDFPGTIQKLESSEAPGLRAIAKILTRIKKAVDFVETAFNEGLPKAIENLKLSDDPFDKLVGGGLQLAYDALSFIVNQTGSIESAIATIAGAFAAIKVGKNVIKLINFINGGGSLMSGLFGGGKVAAEAVSGGASSVGKAGIFSRLGAKVGQAFGLFGAGGGFATLGGLFGLGAAGYAGAKMIEANLNDEQLNKVSGYQNEEGNVIQSMSKRAVKAAKAYYDAFEDTGSERAMDARENLAKILTEEGYGEGEFAIDLFDKLFEGLGGEDNEALRQQLQERFKEILPEHEDLGIAEAIKEKLSLKKLNEEPIEIPIEPAPNTQAVINEKLAAMKLQAVVNLIPGAFGSGEWGGAGGGGNNYLQQRAKGDWNVPYDTISLLHRGERVLTKSQNRKQEDAEARGNSEMIGALQGLRNDMKNMKLVVGKKTFGKAVVDYGGRRMNGYLGKAEGRYAAGYGT